MGAKLEIRIVSKAKNAILARFADDCGSVKAAAEAIGITPGLYSCWLNFKLAPIGVGKRRQAKFSERNRQALLKLAELTGRKITDIFPLTEEQRKKLAAPRIMEHSIECARITSQVEQKYLSYDPEEELDLRISRIEMAEDISQQLGKLNYRHREILKMVYGLNSENYAYSTAEVAERFQISRSRVGQLVSDAIRKLQSTDSASHLAKYL